MLNITFKSTRNRNGSDFRSGTITVEFAIVAGLAFFFFFSALEFCRVSMMRQTIELALYEGARVGVCPGATNAEVTATTQGILRTVGITAATITVTPSVITEATTSVSVRVQMALNQNTFAAAFFFKSRTIDRTFTIQRENAL